jgi:Domain of unknown function (DUF4145)
MVEHGQSAGGAVEYKVVPEGRSDYRVNHLPDDVRDYYENAITVLEAGVPDAAAVQLRRTLEAAAQHFGVKPYPLAKTVKELMSQDLITAQFGDVLGHIRKVGNVGAHASSVRVDEEEARRALRFTTQVLRNLFEIPAELKALGTAPDEEDSESTSESTS